MLHIMSQNKMLPPYQRKKVEKMEDGRWLLTVYDDRDRVLEESTHETLNDVAAVLACLAETTCFDTALIPIHGTHGA